MTLTEKESAQSWETFLDSLIIKEKETHRNSIENSSYCYQQLPKVPIKRFPKGSHRYAGTLYTNSHNGRECILVSLNGNQLSYQPISLRHFYTINYAQNLYHQNPKHYHMIHQLGDPKLYMAIKNIDPKSEAGMQIIANFGKVRMTKKQI